MKKLYSLFEEKLIHYKQRTISKVVTLIDPRFKKVEFRSQVNYEEAVNIVQNLLAGQLKNINQIEENVGQISFDTGNQNKTKNKEQNDITKSIFSLIQNFS